MATQYTRIKLKDNIEGFRKKIDEHIATHTNTGFV